MTTAVEKVIPTKNIPRGQSPMELLTPRELTQATETRLQATTGRVTIPDPSDTLGDPVEEQTVRKLIETAGRLVTNRNAPGYGVPAPYGTIDDAGRVQLSQEMMTRAGVSDTTLPTKSSRVPDRKIREMPVKKVSRVIDVQQNNQLKYSSRGVPDTDSRACFSHITSDTGRQLGESAPEFEDLLDHYGDGLWRCNDSPSVSDGGAGEPREDP